MRKGHCTDDLRCVCIACVQRRDGPCQLDGKRCVCAGCPHREVHAYCGVRTGAGLSEELEMKMDKE